MTARLVALPVCVFSPCGPRCPHTENAAKSVACIDVNTRYVLSSHCVCSQKCQTGLMTRSLGNSTFFYLLPPLSIVMKCASKLLPAFFPGLIGIPSSQLPPSCFSPFASSVLDSFLYRYFLPPVGRYWGTIVYAEDDCHLLRPSSSTQPPSQKLNHASFLWC